MKHFERYRLSAHPQLFQLIEALVDESPARLSMHHYHELDGQEVTEPEDIRNALCAHCLFGWIVNLTPGAPDVEALGEDPMKLANAILTGSGRLPIPKALQFSDEVSAMKIIRGRAAEERQLEKAAEMMAHGPS